MSGAVKFRVLIGPMNGSHESKVAVPAFGGERQAGRDDRPECDAHRALDKQTITWFHCRALARWLGSEAQTMAIDATRDRAFTFPALLLWCGVVALVLVGVAASIGRSVYPGDFAMRAEPFRVELLSLFGRHDPALMYRPEDLEHLDSRFRHHPLATRVHVVAGGVFLVLVSLQFSSRIRRRHIRFHRWSGRLLVVLAVGTGLTGLFFGLLMPFGGRSEAVAIGLFGGLFLFSLSRAYLAIRRREVAVHREWMIRAFALAIAISTVRIVGAVLDVTLPVVRPTPQEYFALSVWTGWLLTLGVAELYILRTRPTAGSAAVRVRANVA